jgi:hypothetical protein
MLGMKNRRFIAIIVALVLVSAGFVLFRPKEKPKVETTAPEPMVEAAVQPATSPVARHSDQGPVVTPEAPAPTQAVVNPVPSLPAEPALSKLERLDQIRDTFKKLASGDAKEALAAARQLTDEAEREVALMTLVSIWRHGELNPPRQRAGAIASLGLETGLGLELVKDPALAVLWANELTEGNNRTALIISTATQLLDTDTAGALAMAEQLPAEDRRKVLDSVLFSWAQKDTDEALGWAQQLPDANERDAAINAIRQAAPVGIGAQLAVKDGYPVITDTFPGTPAQLSGQIRPGDRILGIAQGDGVFTDTRSLSLQEVVEVIRGAPGTPVQLQLAAADASANSAPRIITILRDQIRFKK